MNFKKILSAFLVIPFLLYGCASSPKPDANQSPQPHPKLGRESSEEVAIGEQINAQIMSSFYAYTEPQMVEYLNKIGNSLAGHAERKELSYRFTLLYNDKIYAASAPGGYIYVTTGLIQFLDNESELAAVIAHEIGELQYHDPRLSKSKKILEEVTRTGAAVAPAFGAIGMLAVLGLVMVNVAAGGQEKTPENRLHESDRRALHYMVDAGYDPQGLIDLVYKFLNAGGEATPYFYDYYQSRPITEERVLNIQKEFQKLPLQGKSFSTNRDTYLEMTKGVREIYKQNQG